jgi:transposase
MGYITQRWESGCHNATQIWREIRKQGFNGSRRIVSEWATKKRKSMQSSDSEATALASEKIIPWSASRASWLMAKQEEKLTEEDRQALERMKQADEKVAEAYILGQRFAGMVRERQHESLLPWLEDVAKSKISALTGFANGIKQDIAAVTKSYRSLPTME